VRDQLEQLVQQMIDRGIRYDDARREFERCFIQRALADRAAASWAPPRSWACTGTR